MSERTGPQVPFVDLSRQHAPLLGEITAAIGGVVERGDFILGTAVDRFEDEFATFLGAKHAIGVGSGTAALTIATLSAGIKPGDQVIVPAYTYIASALGPLHAGAEPVFCDVEPETGLIDLDSAASVLTDRCTAIVVVHLFGQCCDMDAVAAFADRHGIAVIEDAAQAHGARWRGRRAGSFGTASAFSFYPSKNLGALGDGGMIVTGDDRVAELARQWRNLGQRSKGEHVIAGFNERLDTLHAAALSVKLPHLDGWNESRREAAGFYRELLDRSIPILPDRPAAESVWHLFPVLVDERERVAAALSERGIGTGVHYAPAVHRQPTWAADHPAGTFPAAERWAAQELSMPMFAGLERDEVWRVAESLAEVTATAGAPG